MRLIYLGLVLSISQLMKKLEKSFPKKTFWIILSAILSNWGCQTVEQAGNSQPKEVQKATPLPFAWPFLEPEMMVSRGGTSQGSEVSLAKDPDPRWLALQKSGLENFERDRLAILAMSGNYRTSFQFTETAGFIKDYSPPRPYFSWGTENVTVIEDVGTSISLQHTLVMYFRKASGEVMGPMVMKHWRQDWNYEDTDLHTFKGNKTWARETLSAETVEGTWTQSVFQVDDSPRYEVTGKWSHGPQFSAWQSKSSDRPLPRREYSVRNDYNVLRGEHRITIVPTGWVHEQHNRKFNLNAEGDSFVAQEVGVNRYERITNPDLSAAEETWQKTSPYWSTVRDTWKKIFATHDRFQIKASHEDSKLWQIHFSHAGEIEQSKNYDAAKWSKKVKETIYKFLNTGETIESEATY